MRPTYPQFNASGLSARIDEYFIYIKGSYRKSRVLAHNGITKTKTITVCDREPENPTFIGLVLFLGFNSLHDFDRYEKKGRYANILSRARLRIAALYEQKLHEHFTSGPIFAIKYLLGLNDNKNTGTEVSTTVNVNIIEAGPGLAAGEKEVIIDDKIPSVTQNIPMNQ